MSGLDEKLLPYPPIVMSKGSDDGDHRVGVHEYRTVDRNGGIITIAVFLGNHRWAEAELTPIEAKTVSDLILSKPSVSALDAETSATPADVGEEPVAWRYKVPSVNDLWTLSHRRPGEQAFDPGDVIIEPLYSATALERVVRDRDEARAALDEVCLSSRQEWQRATSAEAKLAEALADRAAQAERKARLEDAAATGTVFEIEHDGFIGEVRGSYVTREGKRGVVLQQIGTRVVHVYGWKWLKLPARASSQEGSDA